MFLNIITPCSRPENLKAIEESINIPKDSFRWIVVFDLDSIPKNFYIPKIAECYTHRDKNSKTGSMQRNFAFNLIEKGHVHFIDDDTSMHEDLWDNIKDKENYDFISFDQYNKNNTLRLKGDVIKIKKIDTNNFIVSSKLCKYNTWVNSPEGDGHFATTCYRRAKNPIYIEKKLSVYNSLREGDWPAGSFLYEDNP